MAAFREENLNFTLWLEKYYNSTSNVPEPPSYLLGVFTFLYVVVFVVGLMGNAAVTFVVLRCRSMRTSINFLFLNLCIADLLVLVLTGPTAVLDMYAKEVWYLGKFMCKMIPFLENVVGNASAVTILAISVERYRLACRTNTQNNASSRAMLKKHMLIWLTSVLGACPFWFITQHKQSILLDGTTVMVCKTPIVLTWHKVYIVITTMLFFLLPMLAILVLYANVGVRLFALFRTEQEKLQSYPREIVTMRRQMIQIIVTVVLVFFICHTPYRSVVLWSMFGNTHTLMEIRLETWLTLIYLTRILLYSNHAINPFVYNFVSRKFRRALLWVCCDKRRRVKRPEEWCEYGKQGPSLHQECAFKPLHSVVVRSEPYGVVRTTEELEAFNRCHRFQRNDFLVLYEKIMLLD